MRYLSLGSGSKGNATLIDMGSGSEQSQDSSCILIDCGFSRKVLFQRMQEAGIDPSRLAAVFTTHEHSDHAKGVSAVCASLDIPMYASFGTAKKMGWLEHGNWSCLQGGQPVEVGALTVYPVVVPHDAKEPVQFTVTHENGFKLGVLSDLGSLTPHLVSVYQGCHGLQLEANHDPHLLQVGPYPPSLKRRVASDFGHLSNEQCADLLQRVRWPGLQQVTIGHISEKNNQPELVSNLVAQVLECAPNEVVILEQDTISSWYSFQ